MKRRGRGFTLLELLIALLLVAIGLTALVRTSTVHTRQLADLRVRAYALIAAQNELVRLRLAPEAQVAGRNETRVEQGGRAFVVRTELSSDLQTGLLQADIQVQAAADPERTVGALKGWL